MGAYRVLPSAGLRVKAIFPFAPNSVSTIFIQIRWAKKTKILAETVAPSCNRLAGVGSRSGPLGLFPQCSRGRKERGCLCGCWESASLAQGVKLPLNELVPI